METIKISRVQLGLTQQEFADYLGVHRSQLSKAEMGTYTLKTSALMKLADLEKLLVSKPAAATIIRYVDDRPSVDYCKRRAAKVNFEVYRLGEKLKSMKEKFETLSGQHTQLESIVERDNDFNDMIKFQKMRLARRLESCDEIAQEALKIKMTVLLAEHNALEKYLMKSLDPYYEQTNIS